MNIRLAEILYSIKRYDPACVTEFIAFFNDLRESARDRYETGVTPEVREEARQESRAYSKIIHIFEQAEDIIQAKQKEERSRRDNSGVVSLPRQSY